MKFKLPALRRFSVVGPALQSRSPLVALAKWSGVVGRVLQSFSAGGPILLVILFLPFVLLSFSPSAAACDAWCQLQKLNDQINAYRAKVSELQGQARTLANQINYMDYQIRITELEIEEKGTEIGLLGTDIEDLGQRLERIVTSLELQEEAFVTRARSAYVADRLTSFDIALGAKTLDDAMHRIKYLRTLESQDREVLEQMRETRDEYNEQKASLEGKKADVETLKSELEAKTTALYQQRQSKAQLLSVTKSDEGTYQQLLAQAEAESAAIRALITVRGGVTCLPSQTYCAAGQGCYYNQRDIGWCQRSLGYSGLSVGGYGCAVSSVAMIASYHGRNITPGDIAANPSVFLPGTALLLGCNSSIYIKGVRIDRTCWLPRSVIDGELAAGYPVMVGLNFGSGYPAHWVVLKSGSNGNYVMNDPWYAGYHDKPFSSLYSVSQIVSVNRIRVY